MSSHSRCHALRQPTRQGRPGSCGAVGCRAGRLPGHVSRGSGDTAPRSGYRRATLPGQTATTAQGSPSPAATDRDPSGAARSDYWNTGPKELARLNCMQVSMSIATSVMATPQFDLGTRKDGNARYLVDGLPEAAVRWRFDTDPHPVRESTRTYPKRVRIYELMSRWQLALTTAWIGPWGCCARWREPGDPSGSLSYRR